ncbi:MAG: DUF5805 domain-containing protein [Halobellus sp.]|uniref:DUF5805 domain-containing protein n=1 Tax=Halobellus sp. TaxID=1979212 RepID=UPI0035D3E6C3
MSTEGSEAERKTVMTYIPAYQKERWKEHADQLGMSQSEFLRTMVQAGRRNFEIPDLPSAEGEQTTRSDNSQNSEKSAQQGEEFRERVRATLSASEYRSWDELLAALTDDIEDRLDTTLQDLQASNEVQYSGRHGGYTLAGPAHPDE